MRVTVRLAVLMFLLLGPEIAFAQNVASPRSFEAIAASTAEIRLYWLGAAEAEGYKVSRDGAVIAMLAADVREYRDTGLEANKTYRYEIVATRGSDNSVPREYVERTFASFPAAGAGKKLGEADYDVVIVQASSGGVTAAIEAGKRGLKVALIEPTTRLGGMPVNGLSATDIRRSQLYISGFLVRLRDRVKELYAKEGVEATGLQYEPRIAHQAMKSLLYATPNVDVFRRARLTKVVSKNLKDERRRVESIEVEEFDGESNPTGRRATFRAKVFIDSTDCGDLAAWAGAPYRVGREPRTPDEPHNGVIYYDRANDAYLPGSTGKGDKRMQSYAYLFVVKDYGKDADKTIPKPPNYNRENYVHTPSWEKSWAVTSGKLPAGKHELNQHPQGGDLQEINYDYPEGDYKERKRVEQRYRDHVLGYLYYIQTEQGQKQLGFPDDEYRDNGGFPPLLYVREGRRIEGEQLPTEREITEARKIVRPESIGLGDYPMDSHAVRVKTDWSSPDMGEGEWWLFKQTPWYPIPFGVIVPKRLDNVFVTTAVSSTHVSFGTFRMEPVRMQFGQVAGIAASLALRYRLAGREVPARQVQDELLPWLRNPNGDNAIVLHHFPDVNRKTEHYNAIQYMAARGFLPEGEKFEPDKPTTRAEAARWLRQLAERSAPPGTSSYVPYFPYAGRTLKREAVPNWTDSAPVTRGELIQAFAAVLNASAVTARATFAIFADLPNENEPLRTAADTMYRLGIEPRLWDGVGALAPDQKLFFRPEAPLSHADMFVSLYIAQIGLGPLFNDSPIDGKNGRAVPPFPTVPKI